LPLAERQAGRVAVVSLDLNVHLDGPTAADEWERILRAYRPVVSQNNGTTWALVTLGDIEITIFKPDA
jgi:hypothetical protein